MCLPGADGFLSIWREGDCDMGFDVLPEGFLGPWLISISIISSHWASVRKRSGIASSSRNRAWGERGCSSVVIPVSFSDAMPKTECALFTGGQTLHLVLGFRRRGSIGIFNTDQQPSRWMGTGITSSLATDMRVKACRDINGDASVNAAVLAFNHIEIPSHANDRRSKYTSVQPYSVQNGILPPYVHYARCRRSSCVNVRAIAKKRAFQPMRQGKIINSPVIIAQSFVIIIGLSSRMYRRITSLSVLGEEAAAIAVNAVNAMPH